MRKTFSARQFCRKDEQRQKSIRTGLLKHKPRALARVAARYLFRLTHTSAEALGPIRNQAIEPVTTAPLSAAMTRSSQAIVGLRHALTAKQSTNESAGRSYKSSRRGIGRMRFGGSACPWI
jgi:hypothetical protein